MERSLIFFILSLSHNVLYLYIGLSFFVFYRLFSQNTYYALKVKKKKCIIIAVYLPRYEYSLLFQVSIYQEWIIVEKWWVERECIAKKYMYKKINKEVNNRSNFFIAAFFSAINYNEGDALIKTRYDYEEGIEIRGYEYLRSYSTGTLTTFCFLAYVGL